MKHHTDKTNTTVKSMARRALILIAVMVTAIAVAVGCVLFFGTSAPVSVDNVTTGEVSTSTAYTNRTGDLTAPNAIKNGDTLTYNYTGASVTVKLPKGTYDLQVWGAEGGGSRLSGNGSSGKGGSGGYSKGRYVISAASANIFIGVGGYGRSSNNGNAAGGWNGGGQGYASGSGEPGNGGGGASHIATGSTNRGELRQYNSYRSEVIIVAGGGGGGGEDTGDAYGHGGGTSGVNGAGSTYNGTQTAAGTGGGFGYGGGTNKGDGGGGGGGWFGGGTISQSSVGADTQGGGGGSGYVNTSYLTSQSTVAGTASATTGGHTSYGKLGDGLIIITVIQVNQPPTSNTNSSTGNNITSTAANYARGTNRNIDIAASRIGQDTDYSNASGSTVNSVYYTAGNSSNYDTLPAANAGVFLNSACTTLATNYLSWSFPNNQTLRITEIKKYPRNGVDGCTQDGRLTLYTRIRDNFGSNTTRGVAVLPFYFTVKENTIAAKTDTFKSYTKGTGDSAYEYRYGTVTHFGTSEDSKLHDYINDTTSIYNPAATSATGKAVFLPKPIAPTDPNGYTIHASDLFDDADTGYDLVSIKTVAPMSGYTQYSNYYSITYDTNGSYASGLVPSITIRATGVRPEGSTYVCATVTAQASESSTKAAVGATTTITLVFRISNTRPYLASTEAMPSGVHITEQLVSLRLGSDATATKTLNISDLVYDIDDTSLTARFAQTASDVKVPTNEYIQVDYANVEVPLSETRGANAALGRSNYYGRTTVNKSNGVNLYSSKTGEGTTATHFRSDIIALAGTAGASQANVTYSFVSDRVISFTARAATQNQYRTASGARDDERLGHFYILVRVIDPADVADTGIWYPIAIIVESSVPTEPTPTANFDITWEHFEDGVEVSGRGNGKDALQGNEDGVIISPISYTDAEGVLHALGTTTIDPSSSKPVYPFAVDPDTFLLNGETGTDAQRYNDFAVVNFNKNGSTNETDWTFGEAYETDAFFTVKPVILYADRGCFAAVPMTQTELAGLGITPAESYATKYQFFGLQIIPLRSTNGYYFQRDIDLIDTHNTEGTVRICINIANRAVQNRRSSYVGIEEPVVSDYPINAITNSPDYSGTVQNNTLIGAVVVNYSIERGDTVQITPYDFAYDLDIDYNNSHINPIGSFNSNPTDPGYGDMADYVLLGYKIPYTTSPASPAPSYARDGEGRLPNTMPTIASQALGFANMANIRANGAQYSSFITLDVSETLMENGIPVINITGESRTTSAIVQIRFEITDGYSSVECTVVVTVNNSAPMLNSNVTPFILYTDGSGASTAMRTASDLAYDKDKDSPTFITDSIRVVAYDEGNTAADGTHYFEALKYDPESGTYVGTNGDEGDGVTVYWLADYVSAMLSKDGSGYDVVYVRALSSTQIFDKPIYIEFGVADGFRSQPMRSTLHVAVDIINANPKVVTDQLSRSGDEQSGYDYAWVISYEDAAEKRIARYIFNSRELAENTPRDLSVADANKIYLFEDADSQQNAMLNPGVYASDTALVAQKSSGVVTSNDFTANPNAAIIVTPAYEDGTFIDVKVLFFQKNNSGNFVQIQTPSKEQAMNSQYWAIKIEDSGRSSAASTDMQIAISYKDNHNGADVYTNPYKTASVKGNTANTEYRFYYRYQSPGITAMHAYYRTDGNAEANTIISSDGGVNVYALDYNYVQSYQIVGSMPTSQQQLQTAKFTDDFRYQYFEKRYTDNSNGETKVVVTSKRFAPNAGSAFYYSPIRISGGTLNGNNNAVDVPMSYIAMPTGVGASGTENSEHVTFANAYSGTSVGGQAGLEDDNYLYWGGRQSDGSYDRTNYKLIFDNLTLTDGKSTWTSWDRDLETSPNSKPKSTAINNNPYITIEYVANGSGVGEIQTESQKGYRNTKRYEITKLDSGLQFNELRMNGNTFREDKYGFSFAKKKDGVRFTGTLRLTFELKTTYNGRDGDIQFVDVEIEMQNSKPEVKYNNVDVEANQKVNVEMDMSDTEGKTVALNNARSTSQDKGDYNLYYEDPDATDTMKFLISSSNGTMTDEEYKYVAAGTNIREYGDAVTDYQKGLTDSDRNPNHGYERFFTVSPGTGTSATLQIIPASKTQINIPNNAQKDTYLSKNNLKEEIIGGQGTGRYYYPFRILYYDDLDGSAFTKGSWGLLTINVYVMNNEIKPVPSLPGYRSNDSSYNDLTYKGKPCYSFSISKDTKFFVDVSSLLTDNDIVLNADGSFALNTDDAWTNLAKDEGGSPLAGDDVYTSGQLYFDYFNMPEASACTYISPSAAPGTTPKLPLTIRRSTATGEDTGMPKTAFIFTATTAFKTSVDIMYTFSDSAGSQTQIIFSISYNNEAPTPNATTFGGGDTLDIVMRTGDSFTVHATDANLFAADDAGGFTSTQAARNLVASGAYPSDSAYTQRQSFHAAGDIRGYLGSIVLGSDDAASTLRFMANVEFTNNGRDQFEIDYSNAAPGELRGSSPMTITLRATGVITTRMTFTLFDSANKEVKISLNVTVLSSAPTVKTADDMRTATGEDKLPTGIDLTVVSNEENTFALAMSYGDVKSIPLRSFMKDADQGDVSGFTVFRNNDNSYFDIENPDNVSAVSVTRGAVWSAEAIVITARDFIPVNGHTARISFRVADAHGTVSSFVRFKVTINPRDVTAVASALNTAKSIEIKSYAQYDEDGEPLVVDLVTDGGTIFADPDATAPSASYNVKVYALLNPETLAPISSFTNDINRDQCLLWTNDISGAFPSYNNVYNYVSRFFAMSLASDGKSITFVPVSATISAESSGTLTAIRLYVVVNKRYTNGGNQTMADRPAYLNVSVANSALVAVQNSPFNSGYPMAEVEVNGEKQKRLRESAFLEFSGTAGDSLTWNLYDLDDRELGLFYDFDLINNRASEEEGAVGGLEEITYVRSELIDVPNSDKQLNKGDPVSVSLSGDGKSVTIKINRKIFTGQPPANGLDNTYTPVYVDIYCADKLGVRAGTSGANNRNVVSTRITVNVENDPPTYKTVSNDRFAVTYSVDTGYVFEAKIENGNSITVNVADIIDDADIDMDQYKLLFTGSDDSLMTSNSGRLLNEDENGRGYIANNSGNLFAVSISEPPNSFGITSLTSITFTCISTARGQVGTCQLQFRDTVASARTPIMYVRLTVDNIKPTNKTGVETAITLMGVDQNADTDAVLSHAQTYSILDFVSDENGDAYDASTGEERALPTYVFIDLIEVFTSDDLANAPDIYGPGMQIEDRDDETGETTISTVNSGCSVDWAEDDPYHQNFTIFPLAGVYGTQKVLLTIIDSGYADGSREGVNDGKSFELMLTITIANPLSDVPAVLDAKSIAFGVNCNIDVESLLGAENAKGYTIKSIVEEGTANNLTITPPESDGSAGWRILGKIENTTTNVTITFSAGGVEITRTLPVIVTANNAPDYKKNDDGPIKKYTYTVARLTDTNNKTLTVYPEDWFEDIDIDDVMSFVGPVTSSQSVKVEAILDYDSNGRAFILLRFNRRGESDITFNVTDLSGRLYQMTITVECTDAPELSWWENVVSMIESNWMWFWIIVGGVLLLIILLIVILVVVIKKRKVRREIEALLNSEAELEEEMMRLSAGGMGFQSFDYLPPAQTAANPGFMIGSSANNPTPNSLQLNAGAGAPPQGTQQPNQAPPPQAGGDGFDPNDF